MYKSNVDLLCFVLFFYRHETETSILFRFIFMF